MKSHFEKIEQVSNNLFQKITVLLGPKPPRNKSLVATITSPAHHPANWSPLVSYIYWV